MTAKIIALAKQIEAAIPSAKEMDEQRRIWFSQSLWHCPDHSYRSDQECFQNWLANRLTETKGYAGAIRVLCEQAEAESEHRVEMLREVAEIEAERIKSGGKP